MVVARTLVLSDDGRHGTQEIARCPRCNPERPVGIPPSRAADTFESFELGRNPALKPALAACKAVADGETWCALLVGEYGTGKTHLAVAALRQFGRGSFWKVPDVLDWLRRNAYGDQGVGIEDALRPFREGTGLLVLDDYGTEKTTDWAAEQLYRILDSRYEAQLPTIITTNADFTVLDGRIRSRFAEGTVVCKGADMRRRAEGVRA